MQLAMERILAWECLCRRRNKRAISMCKLTVYENFFGGWGIGGIIKIGLGDIKENFIYQEFQG